MAKEKVMMSDMSEPHVAPVPPSMPSSEEQFLPGATDLDGHVSSTNPHEGRFVDHEDDCAGDCPFCE